MVSCRQCRQENPDDANYCHQCGISLGSTFLGGEAVSRVPSPPQMPGDEALWRQFIGPNADQYLAQFKRFSANGRSRFALSWNWPAFLFIPFLWFLYRKMYLHAFVYAIGPVISTYVTGDLTGGIVWSIMAGATANYLYYCHCKEQMAAVKKAGWSDPAVLEAALKEAGGVQPYVIWAGVVFYALFFVTLLKVVQEGPPEMDRLPSRPAKLSAMKTA
jgi:hypothetical protein